MITNLPIDGSFLITASLSVCLEANADCAVVRTVANNMKIDKPVCSSTGEFAIPGFSLTSWKNLKGLMPSDPLPDFGKSLLMNDLKIAKYMEDPQCTISSSGWQAGGKD